MEAANHPRIEGEFRFRRHRLHGLDSKRSSLLGLQPEKKIMRHKNELDYRLKTQYSNYF